MKTLLLLLAVLSSTAFGQGGTTSSDIYPAVTGQNLGNPTQRWNLYGQNVDIAGTQTISDLITAFTPVIDVRAYGAKCDGVTDDTAAIQSAINVATTSNAYRGLLFPPGKCLVTIPNSGVAFQVNVNGLTFQGSGTSDNESQSTTPQGGTQIMAVGGPGKLFQLGAEKQAAITSISRAGNIVTATVAALPVGGGAWISGHSVVIASVTDSSFNGTFSLTSASSTTLTWAQTAADASSSGGTSTEAYDAGSYDGLEGFTFKNLEIRYTGAVTASLNNGKGTYGTGSTAITDWRGGSIIFENVRLRNWDYPFWGIQSDVDQFKGGYYAYNHHGVYLGPRSDQANFIGGYFQFNDTAVWTDSAKRARFFGTQFVGNGSNVPEYGIKIGSQYAWGGSRSIVFEDCWFEEYDSVGSINGEMSIGLGDSYQSIDTQVIRPHVVANSSFLVNFVTVDNADYVTVEQPTFYRDAAPFSAAFFSFTGTTSPTHVYIRRFAFNNSYTLAANVGSGSPIVTQVTDGPTARTFDYFAGTAQTEGFKFNDSGTEKFRIEKTNGNALQIYDTTAGLPRLFAGLADTVINAKSGGYLKINSSTNSSGLGLEVFSGSTSPALVASIDGNGAGTFNSGSFATPLPAASVQPAAPSILHSNCSGTATAATTLGMFEFGNLSTTCTGTSTTAQPFVAPIAGTAYNLYVKAVTGGTNASSGVFTLLKGGVAQTLTCTVGTGTSCNDTTHTFTFAAGDSLAISFTTQTAETLANISVSFAVKN